MFTISVKIKNSPKEYKITTEDNTIFIEDGSNILSLLREGYEMLPIVALVAEFERCLSYVVG